MGKINVLTFDVANLIAAGEVVDRPASVIKELIENSIDAGASKITVEIKNGGISFMRVADDGVGMSRADLPLSIRRHATSKIESSMDLEHIITLGFRGEALAATAAVSRLRIITRQAADSFGFVLTSEAGTEPKVEETGCPVGTTVIVEDLFYNVPARRKFLKRESTEMIAVTSVVEKTALSHPEIAVRYIADGEVKLQTGGDGKLRNTVYALWGRECASRLSPVSREENGVKVTGLVSEPDYVKSNRNMQSFFINGRYVKSKTAAAAIEQAYISRIPDERFPVCVINIAIDPSAVDVNVHPSKLEVKFSNERAVFDCIYFAVQSALEASSTQPELKLARRDGDRLKLDDRVKLTEKMLSAGSDRGGKYHEARTSLGGETKRNGGARGDSFWATGQEARELIRAFAPKGGVTGEQLGLKPTPEPSPKADRLGELDRSSEDCRRVVPTESGAMLFDIGENGSEGKPYQTDTAQTAEAFDVQSTATDKSAGGEAVSAEASASTDDVLAVPEYTVIGEAFNCYVMVEIGERILVIDKHAAHERIIYEELRRKAHSAEAHPQLLLVPVELAMSESEAHALDCFAAELSRLGFAYSYAGGKLTVTELPEELSADEGAEMLCSVADRAVSSSGDPISDEGLREEFFDRALYQAACKAAIKGGRIYNKEITKWLVDRLLSGSENGESSIKTCPHGRPVAFEIKKSSLERQFERTV